MQIIQQGSQKVLTIGSDFDATARLTAESSQAASRIAAELERRVEYLREAAEVLAGLPRDWQQRDPGKYRPCYYFLGHGDRRVVVRELLPDGASQFQGDRKAWIRHLAQLGYYRPLDMVPPDMPVVSLAEVAKYPCSRCSTDQPLIESYCQTYDSPDGDVWEKRRLVLCCGRVQVVKTERQAYRF